MDALVEEARAAGTEVVFVEAPSLNDPLPRQALDVYESVAAQQQVPFLRFTPERVPELGEPNLYYDRGHLNAAGASVLSRLFAEALRAEHLIPVEN